MRSKSLIFLFFLAMLPAMALELDINGGPEFRPGQEVCMLICGMEPFQEVKVDFFLNGSPAGSITGITDANGCIKHCVTIPVDFPPGEYKITVFVAGYGSASAVIKIVP